MIGWSLLCCGLTCCVLMQVTHIVRVEDFPIMPCEVRIYLSSYRHLSLSPTHRPSKRYFIYLVPRFFLSFFIAMNDRSIYLLRGVSSMSQINRLWVSISSPRGSLTATRQWISHLTRMGPARRLLALAAVVVVKLINWLGQLLIGCSFCWAGCYLC